MKVITPNSFVRHIKDTEKISSPLWQEGDSEKQIRRLSAWLCLVITEAGYELTYEQVPEQQREAFQPLRRGLIRLIVEHSNDKLRMNALRLLEDLLADISNPI